MSVLDYSELTSSGLILQPSVVAPDVQHSPAVEQEETQVDEEPVVEGAVNMSEIGIGNTSKDVAAADILSKDLDKVKANLMKYNDYYFDMNATSGRIYSFNPDFDQQNPVNDPISHEYIPRINEAALADIQSRLDFQNRVYAYTAVGLISVVIAGIMFNSNR
jgi:hypothetical protein